MFSTRDATAHCSKCLNPPFSLSVSLPLSLSLSLSLSSFLIVSSSSLVDNSLVFTIKKYILSQLRLKNLICLSFHLELSRYDTEVRSGVWHWFDRFQNIDHLERVHRTRGHISSIKIDRCRLNSRQFFFVVVMEHLDNGIVYHVNSHSMVSLLSLNGLNILDKIDIFFTLFYFNTSQRLYYQK